MLVGVGAWKSHWGFDHITGLEPICLWAGISSSKRAFQSLQHVVSVYIIISSHGRKAETILLCRRYRGSYILNLEMRRWMIIHGFGILSKLSKNARLFSPFLASPALVGLPPYSCEQQTQTASGSQGRNGQTRGSRTWRLGSWSAQWRWSASPRGGACSQSASPTTPCKCKCWEGYSTHTTD